MILKGKGATMNCIAAVDASWGIGKGGQLLVSIPQDMKYFRQVTANKVLIMGRKTLESFPGGKPLRGRINIVISRNPHSLNEEFIRVREEESISEAMKRVGPGQAIVLTSPAEALAAAALFDEEDVFVIGGGSIYREFLPYCRRAYITKIDYRYSADTYFPNLDEDPSWILESEGEEQTAFDLIYTFTVYRNTKL